MWPDLTASSTKEHVDAPAVLAKKKKEGVMARAKKNVASKTATSAFGKKVMKAIVNEETTSLINALKKIVRKESGNPKKVPLFSISSFYIILQLKPSFMLCIHGGQCYPPSSAMCSSLLACFPSLASCA